jgi:hypothetical protein
MIDQFNISTIEPEWLDVVKEFPKIFLEPSKEVLGYYDQYVEKFPIEELCNLRFGFEHGSGWKEIVRGFCKEMQELADKAESNGNVFQYKSCIMKEKFGTFTPQGDIEHDGCWEKYRDEYYDIIDKWEKASLEICEVTGKPGKLCNLNGWYRTLCDDEAEKIRNRLK